MNKTEQQYIDKLNQQLNVATGLQQANQSTDKWTQKMYRERMDMINEECCQLCGEVNNQHRGGKF